MNTLERELYSKQYQKVEAIAECRNHVTQIPYKLHEHYDIHAKVRYIGYMEDPHITTDDVTTNQETAYIQKIKLNSTSTAYIKMISISPVVLDKDTMAPVIYFYLLHI